MLNKYILRAQKVLRKLEGTPIIVQPDNSVQVTYDYDTYKDLCSVLVAVSQEPLKDVVGYEPYVSEPSYPDRTTPYHRERI